MRSARGSSDGCGGSTVQPADSSSMTETGDSHVLLPVAGDGAGSWFAAWHVAPSVSSLAAGRSGVRRNDPSADGIAAPPTVSADALLTRVQPQTMTSAAASAMSSISSFHDMSPSFWVSISFAIVVRFVPHEACGIGARRRAADNRQST